MPFKGLPINQEEGQNVDFNDVKTRYFELSVDLRSRWRTRASKPPHPYILISPPAEPGVRGFRVSRITSDGTASLTDFWEETVSSSDNRFVLEKLGNLGLFSEHEVIHHVNANASAYLSVRFEENNLIIQASIDPDKLEELQTIILSYANLIKK